MKLKNVEQRRAVLEVIGWDIVLNAINSKVIDEWNGYQLIEAELNDDENIKAKLLRMTCPSTERKYIERVHPFCKTCKEALAWQYQEKVLPEFNGELILQRNKMAQQYVTWIKIRLQSLS